MSYRKLFFNVTMAILCCTYSPAITAGFMMPNMEDFEKELAEANRAIEEYVASLSPEEQAAFNQSVNDMAQMFENMSDDEFESFLGEMFADEPMMMEQNPFDIPAQPIIQEEVVEVPLSTQDKQKVETALAIIDDIITQSNLFAVIVNSSSDIPNRINNWSAKGSIPNWQNGTDWNTFKAELETFIQKLYRSEEQDLTTKKYKYLLELIADEGLYNNLIQLQAELKALIPTINIPEFAIQKLSSESKTAIKDILSKYAEAFYLLGIPKALDTLFEKYAPEADKIRAAEEAATKKALDASKGTRSPVAATSAGTEGDMGYGDYGYDSGYYPDYGYGDYGYSPYDYGYGDYGSYGSDYGSDSRSGGSTGGGRSGGGSTGGGAGRSAQEDEESEESDKDKKDKKKKAKFVPVAEIERALGDIKSNFEQIKNAMVDEEGEKTTLANLAEHIKNEDASVDITLANYILPTVIDKNISNINQAVRIINSKAQKLNPDDLTHYQQELTKLVDANKKSINDLRSEIDKFETFTTEERAAIASQPAGEPSKRTDIESENISKAKRWAYFEGEDNLLTDEDEALKEQIVSRKSLFEIKDNIDEMFDKIEEFTKKIAKAPKKEVFATEDDEE